MYGKDDVRMAIAAIVLMLAGFLDRLGSDTARSQRPFSTDAEKTVNAEPAEIAEMCSRKTLRVLSGLCVECPVFQQDPQSAIRPIVKPGSNHESSKHEKESLL